MRCWIVATAMALASAAAFGASAPMRALTFEERVAATEALERVYDARRIWPPENPAPRPPFESRMPRHVIEAKVRDTLRKGAALEALWHRPITTEQLQAEMDRMARDSKDRELLQALLHALGDDPVLAAECLARPILTARLFQGWHAWDRRFHEEVWQQVERAQGVITEETFESYPEGELHRNLFVMASEGTDARVPTADASPQRIAVSEHAMERLRRQFGSSDGGVVLREEREEIVLALVVRDAGEELEVLVRSFAKQSGDAWWASAGAEFPATIPAARGAVKLPPSQMGSAAPCDAWLPMNDLTGLPEARVDHTAIWTGSEMIVWGGYAGVNLGSGGRYVPATDTWTATSGTGAPAGRYGHTAVWTGMEMIVWGGGRGGGFLDTGGRYDPVTDSWIATSVVGTEARYRHSAVWTGTTMIVWGGAGFAGLLRTGHVYDPASNTWTAMSTAGVCPTGRRNHSAVWTGSEMIVWGGLGGGYQRTGGRYDPTTDTWRATSTAAACPSPRADHTAVWSGAEMIVWGGWDGNELDTGARYDPVADLWTATSVAGACPAGRWYHVAVWTGSEMIVWGGSATGGYQETGGRYVPASDSWAPTSTAGGCPTARLRPSAIWTGSELIVWGGTAYLGYRDTGGRYSPATDSWVATSTAASCPTARHGHTAVWTGLELIVWGGRNAGGYRRTGGRYTPAIDAWDTTSTSGSCPGARERHTAVWTGQEMIVWGGVGAGGPLHTGARYVPAADGWSSTTTGIPAPSARGRHSAVWTGTEMIVWGGDAGGALATGGRYHPPSDGWVPTGSGAGCPSPRFEHTAAWDGSRMTIWGGDSGAGVLGTGSRYDPGTDTWAATSSGAGCPPARRGHTAVSTGTEIIVWGGDDGSVVVGTGGRYHPVTDTWAPVATGGGCPTPRAGHTVVWTGSEMIVWGGDDGAALDTGGRYRPATDSWEVTRTGASCPSGRSRHAAVWTGSEMIVWGGSPDTATGGRYALLCPTPYYLVGAGLGPPSPPEVQLHTPRGAPTTGSFLAYGSGAWGVTVASGRLSGGSLDEILTGPGPGDVLGPHVRGWDRDGTALAKVGFYAYGTLKYGVNVAGGDLDGDAFDELLTGAGPGTVFGPHVRGFNYDDAAVASMPKLSFFAYGTLQYGANVADGSVDADATAELATGPGPGATFSPQVRGFDYDGASLSAMAKINYVALPITGYGVNVALGDVDGDGYAEIAATPGPGPTHPARFVGHDYDGSAIVALPGFDVVAYAGTGYGGRVGAGDVEADGRADLLCGAGRDPSADSTVTGYRYAVAQQLELLPVTFTPFGTLGYGVNVAAGRYGH